MDGAAALKHRRQLDNATVQGLIEEGVLASRTICYHSVEDALECPICFQVLLFTFLMLWLVFIFFFE